jgi:hypothetical protein
MILVGSRVLFRLFNTPEGKFYGDTHTGLVTAIETQNNGEKKFTVRYTADFGETTLKLKRKEIKRILK